MIETLSGLAGVILVYITLITLCRAFGKEVKVNARQFTSGGNRQNVTGK